MGTPQPIAITGTNFTGRDRRGLLRVRERHAGPPPVTANGTGTPFTVNAAGTSITFADLPDATRGVTGVQTYWYIRVKKGSAGWSTVYTGNGNNQTLNAPRLTIGRPAADLRSGLVVRATSGRSCCRTPATAAGTASAPPTSRSA